MFEAQVEYFKRLNLLYDDIERHHVITNLTGAMAIRYVFKACNKSEGYVLRTCVTRLVATEMPARRVGSKVLNYPATNATVTLEICRVTINTIRVRQRKSSYTNVSNVAQPVEAS